MAPVAAMTARTIRASRSARQPGPARSRRAVAQLQPPLERPVRPARRRRRGSRGGDGGVRAADGTRRRTGGARACSPSSLVIWLGERLLHRSGRQRGVVLPFGKLHRDDHAGPALAPAVADPDARSGRHPVSCARVEVGYRTARPKRAQGIADADRRREHRRRAVRGAVPAQGQRRARLSVQQPQARRRRCCRSAETAMREVVGARRWIRCCTRSRQEIAVDVRRADAGDPRPLRHRHPGQAVTMQNAQPPEQVQAAFDDAVKAGQDRERAEERGPGVRERRHPEGARHGGAADAGGRRLRRA